MKRSSKLLVWTAWWLVIGILGVITRSDVTSTIGLVNSVVCLVGSELAELIEKKESK